jgi:hypothetical protein
MSTDNSNFTVNPPSSPVPPPATGTEQQTKEDIPTSLAAIPALQKIDSESPETLEKREVEPLEKTVTLQKIAGKVGEITANIRLSFAVAFSPYFVHEKYAEFAPDAGSSPAQKLKLLNFLNAYNHVRLTALTGSANRTDLERKLDNMKDHLNSISVPEDLPPDLKHKINNFRTADLKTLDAKFICNCLKHTFKTFTLDQNFINTLQKAIELESKNLLETIESDYETESEGTTEEDSSAEVMRQEEESASDSEELVEHTQTTRSNIISALSTLQKNSRVNEVSLLDTITQNVPALNVLSLNIISKSLQEITGPKFNISQSEIDPLVDQIRSFRGKIKSNDSTKNQLKEINECLNNLSPRGIKAADAVINKIVPDFPLPESVLKAFRLVMQWPDVYKEITDLSRNKSATLLSQVENLATLNKMIIREKSSLDALIDTGLGIGSKEKQKTLAAAITPLYNASVISSKIIDLTQNSPKPLRDALWKKAALQLQNQPGILMDEIYKISPLLNSNLSPPFLYLQVSLGIQFQLDDDLLTDIDNILKGKPDMAQAVEKMLNSYNTDPQQISHHPLLRLAELIESQIKTEAFESNEKQNYAELLTDLVVEMFMLTKEAKLQIPHEEIDPFVSKLRSMLSSIEASATSVDQQLLTGMKTLLTQLSSGGKQSIIKSISSLTPTFQLPSDLIDGLRHLMVHSKINLQKPEYLDEEMKNLESLAETLITIKETTKNPAEKKLLEKADRAMTNALQIRGVIYSKTLDAKPSSSLDFLRAYLWNKYLVLAESHDQPAVNQYTKDLSSFFSGVSVVDIIESKECADALQEANVGPQEQNIILKSLIDLKLSLGEEFKLTRSTYEHLTLASIKYSKIRQELERISNLSITPPYSEAVLLFELSNLISEAVKTESRGLSLQDAQNVYKEYAPIFQEITTHQQVYFDKLFQGASTQAKTQFYAVQKLIGKETPIALQGKIVLIQILNRPEFNKIFAHAIRESTKLKYAHQQILKQGNVLDTKSTMDPCFFKAYESIAAMTKQTEFYLPTVIMQQLLKLTGILDIKTSNAGVTQWFTDSVERSVFRDDQKLLQQGDSLATRHVKVIRDEISRIPLRSSSLQGFLTRQPGFINYENMLYYRQEWSDERNQQYRAHFEIVCEGNSGNILKQHCEVLLDLSSLGDLSPEKQQAAGHAIQKIVNDSDFEQPLNEILHKREIMKLDPLIPKEFVTRMETMTKEEIAEDAEYQKYAALYADLVIIASDFTKTMENKFWQAVMNLGDPDAKTPPRCAENVSKWTVNELINNINLRLPLKDPEVISGLRTAMRSPELYDRIEKLHEKDTSLKTEIMNLVELRDILREAQTKFPEAQRALFSAINNLSAFYQRAALSYLNNHPPENEQELKEAKDMVGIWEGSLPKMNERNPEKIPEQAKKANDRLMDAERRLIEIKSAPSSAPHTKPKTESPQ